jgi:hypothetical protein
MALAAIDLRLSQDVKDNARIKQVAMSKYLRMAPPRLPSLMFIVSGTIYFSLSFFFFKTAQTFTYHFICSFCESKRQDW